MPKHHRKKQHSGFTFIELLIVFSILAVLSLTGIASFNAFTTNQTVSNAALDLKNMFNYAKYNSISQVVGNNCSGQPFNGYKVLACCKSGGTGCPVCNLTNDYEMDIMCGGTATAVSGKNLPKGVTFDDTNTTSRSYYFPSLSSNVIGFGRVVIDGYSSSRQVKVSSTGVIQSGFISIPPTPTPTNTPTPTPTATPTPTPYPVMAQDTFQRANHSPGWGTSTDTNVWGQDASSDSNFSVNGNIAQAITSGGAIKNGILGGTAANSQVIFIGSTTNFSTSDFGALLRFSNSNNWYKAYIDGSNLLLRRMLLGSNSILAQTPFAATSGTSYTLKFQVVGSTLQTKVWPSSGSEPGSWMVTATDSNFASGNAGLSVAGTGGTITYKSFIANQL